MAQSFGIYNPNMYLQFALFIPQYLPRCSQRKTPTEAAKLFVDTTPKHKTAFLSLKFTVFFFGISRKAFEKALKTAHFVSFRAKP